MTITKANGSTLTLFLEGSTCSSNSAAGGFSYFGTYIITGGTGEFSGVTGGVGSFTMNTNRGLSLNGNIQSQ